MTGIALNLLQESITDKNNAKELKSTITLCTYIFGLKYFIVRNASLVCDILSARKGQDT